MESLFQSVSGFLKLVHYAASGMGSVAGTMLAPWKARREALARQIAAHGESDSLRILAEGQASAVQIISEANEEARSTLMGENSLAVTQIDIGETIRQRLEFQEEKRQSNIISVLNEAAEELGDKEVQDHEPDHDWTARFFNEVQDVSSDEMRTIWAKILAGEVSAKLLTEVRISLRFPDHPQRVRTHYSRLQLVLPIQYDDRNQCRRFRPTKNPHTLYFPKTILGAGTHPRIPATRRIPTGRGNAYPSGPRTSKCSRRRTKPSVLTRPQRILQKEQPPHDGGIPRRTLCHQIGQGAK